MVSRCTGNVRAVNERRRRAVVSILRQSSRAFRHRTSNAMRSMGADERELSDLCDSSLLLLRALLELGSAFCCFSAALRSAFALLFCVGASAMSMLASLLVYPSFCKKGNVKTVSHSHVSSCFAFRRPTMSNSFLVGVAFLVLPLLIQSQRLDLMQHKALMHVYDARGKLIPRKKKKDDSFQ
jgi:hypothetical protein